MTTFREFCDGVLGQMPRATGRERDDIRDELLDHLMEHRDMLMDYGVEELEAERRAIEAMGDPEEIGRAWNKTLSPLWLWLGRLCAAVFVLIFLFNASDIYYKADCLVNSLTVQHTKDVEINPHIPEGYKLIRSEDPGITKSFGEHVIRIHRIQLWQHTFYEDVYSLEVSYLTHHKDPWGVSLNSSIFRAIEYTGAIPDSGGSTQTSYATWYEQELKLEPGQNTVGIYLEHMGNEFTAELELDLGGVGT